MSIHKPTLDERLALTRECPFCKSGANDWCMIRSRKWYSTFLHRSRMELVGL